MSDSDESEKGLTNEEVVGKLVSIVCCRRKSVSKSNKQFF